MSCGNTTVNGYVCLKEDGHRGACNFARSAKPPEKKEADPHVSAVIALLASRSETGLKKYGVGLDREDLSVLDWLDHLQQELLDAANYVQRLKSILSPLFPKTKTE